MIKGHIAEFTSDNLPSMADIPNGHVHDAFKEEPALPDVLIHGCWGEKAVAWFEKTPVHGIRWTEKLTATGMERFAERDPAAPDTWARFYELGTDRPVFMGRDSVVHYDVNEIELERRNGYGWYSEQPRSVLKAYRSWKAKLQP